MILRRFCPQCGRHLDVRKTDQDGFCDGPKGIDYEFGDTTGCDEHLVRFDAVTGKRLEALPPVHASPWDGYGYAGKSGSRRKQPTSG